MRNLVTLTPSIDDFKRLETKIKQRNLSRTIKKDKKDKNKTPDQPIVTEDKSCKNPFENVEKILVPDEKDKEKE